MFISKSTINEALEHYKGMLLYYQYLEHLFEVLDRRLEYGGNGKRLLPISYKRIFTNSNNYALYSHREYPGEIWLPPWHGRFYIDAGCLAEPTDYNHIDDCPISQIKYLAFVWIWLGCNDAYIADKEQPECWLGITEPEPIDPTTRIYEVANMIWKFIRVEQTTEKQNDQWIKGKFCSNNSNSHLKGCWKVKRFLLQDLSNMYGIQQFVVSPLIEAFNQMAQDFTFHP